MVAPASVVVVAAMVVVVAGVVVAGAASVVVAGAAVVVAAGWAVVAVAAGGQQHRSASDHVELAPAQSALDDSLLFASLLFAV